MSAPPHGKSPSGKRLSSAWVPARPEQKATAPATLGDVLVGTEEIFAQRSGSAIRRAEWTAIVGSRIASRTRVGKLNRGVLTVKVASSAWSNELSFLKTQLLAKLNRAGHEITDLRFFVDQIADDAQSKKRHPLAKPAKYDVAPAPLPDELVQRLKDVEDPNLRAVIAEAARASLDRSGKS